MNSMYYYRNSTCVDQLYQKCAAGCSLSGTTCASTTTSPTSAFEQIELIAEPTTTPQDVGYVSDRLFELAIEGEDIGTIQDKTEQEATTTSSTDLLLPPSQQTFVSGDLRYSQEQYQPQQLSGMQQVLATMKDMLLRVLAYLRPFGRPEPAEGTYDEWTE
jgi:hypothetical protein